MIERTCQHCGKNYRTYPSIRLFYCGAACSYAARKNGEHSACEQCGKAIYRHPCRPEHRYCSKSCARTAANLTAANPAFTRDVSGDKNPMAGKGLAGPENGMYGRRKSLAPRWNGGTKSRRDGYIQVIVPDDHPHPSYASKTGTKYLLAHRYVMEQALGRYLEPGEVVHHRDGNPRNNDLGNLQLFASQSDHIRIGHGGV
jgi:hypothetical protein